MMAHALSDGMSSQLERMQADGARCGRPVDYDGMGRYGADLDTVGRPNGSYRGLGKMASLRTVNLLLDDSLFSA